MILQNTQRKRFYRIFNYFIVFARNRLAERGVLPQTMANNRMPSNRELQIIEEAVWGKGGHREVIDEFVAETTLMSRTDLKACAAWKQGIYETFYVCRRGADTLFSLGDYVFAVRGISHEIDDDMAALPDAVTCVLVPFDGVITYLVCLGTHRIGVSEEYAEVLAKDVDRSRNEGRFAKTERQFALLAPKAVEAREARRVESERERAEYEEHGDDVVEGQHQSVISQLKEQSEDSPSMVELKKVVQQAAPDFVVTSIEAVSLRGKPVTSLEKVLERYPVEKLRRVEGSNAARRMKKAELVSRLHARYLDQVALVAKNPLLLGVVCTSDVADLCEEGGVRSIRREQLKNIEKFPMPRIPYVNYFRDGDDFVVVVPDELVAAFSGLDFDDVRARMNRFEAAANYLSFVCDTRGLILLDEAVQGLVERFEGFDEGELKRALGTSMYMPVAELDDETYVVAPDLMVWSDRDREWVLDKDVARKTLEEQAGKKALWPSKEECVYRNVFEMALKIDEGRALLNFLEAHVPDDENDISFPYEYMKWVVDHTLAPLDPQESVDIITDIVNAVALNIAQAHRVMRLIMALQNVLPKRVLNGYSPQRFTDEVMGGKKSDRLVVVRSSR